MYTESCETSESSGGVQDLYAPPTKNHVVRLDRMASVDASVPPARRPVQPVQMTTGGRSRLDYSSDSDAQPYSWDRMSNELSRGGMSESRIYEGALHTQGIINDLW